MCRLSVYGCISIFFGVWFGMMVMVVISGGIGMMLLIYMFDSIHIIILFNQHSL